MKRKSIQKEYILEILMKSSSLHELLTILNNICVSLDLKYLNPKIKHFRYFQFTFFGLLVKARSLLDLMIFRCEFLKRDYEVFEEIYDELMQLKKTIDSAYKIIHASKMAEGKIQIIAAAERYNVIFEKINQECMKKI